MNIDNLYDYFSSLELSDFYKIIGTFLACITLLCAGYGYFYYSKVETLQNALKAVDKQTIEAQDLLTRLEKVKRRSEEINKILEEDKDFKLKKFFDEATQKLQLKQYRDADIHQEEVLNKQYIQVTLSAQFKNINTKQLCTLLQAIEEKKRIYTIELNITKSGESSIDAALTIGTLTSQVDRKKA